MTLRQLTFEERDLIWTIDRSEVIENVYRLEHGLLTLQPLYFDARGWPPGEPENSTPSLHACFDRGGGFFGMFESEQLIGAMVIATHFLGPNRDRVQLKFLYVSHAHRAKGVGTRLFDVAKRFARERGARYMYISSTPSENTVNFYKRHGCVVAAEPDLELFALEPEDIHFLCPL